MVGSIKYLPVVVRDPDRDGGQSRSTRGEVGKPKEDEDLRPRLKSSPWYPERPGTLGVSSLRTEVKVSEERTEEKDTGVPS